MRDFFKMLEALFFILGLVFLLDSFEKGGIEHIATAVGTIAVVYLGTRVL